ncbi:acyltransferase family protein [Phycicoccus sonneratiae]|uniref:Acyltransferase n=1 Tax=Phycicoccus sonneratiae TaxID=2807628 RepID=A0ABS2CGL5_9MICO|nr:acyltransferase [Phycicoccus sonneraticus]MBM6399007.1 acyltransferase [Phycicoccus sonneraticus]
MADSVERMDSPTRRPALPALTGLRALAAAWVVLFHYREEILRLQPVLAPLDTLMRAGYLGVDLFFALSGFVLAYTYADRMRTFRGDRSARFVRNRFARVWPVHVVALHVDVAIAAVVGTLGTTSEDTRRGLGAYVENLGMVHYWVNDRPSFNSPAWSISAEWFAYLLAPVLFVLVARLRRPGSALALAGLAYAVMLGIFATMALPNGNLENMFWVRIMGEFLGGMLLCIAWTRGGARLGGFAWLLPLTVAVVALIPAASAGHYWAAPALGLGTAGLAASSGPLVRLLSGPTLVAAGEASYALYMVHWLFERPIEWATARAAGNGLASALVLAGIVLVLGVTARLVATRIEQPARRWLVDGPRGRAPATWSREVPQHRTRTLAVLR